MKIQKVFFRKPKGSLSHYLRWRIASSSEGAIFGAAPTSDSDSLPKLCPIGLDQTSKVKGTNLDKFLNIFSIEICFLRFNFSCNIYFGNKSGSGMFTCIKYLTLFKVYSRPKLGNNWTTFKKDIMWRLQKKQGKFSIYWTCFMILDFYWTSSKCTNANGADLWRVEFNERIAQNSDHLSLCHSPAFRSEVNQHYIIKQGKPRPSFAVYNTLWILRHTNVHLLILG